MSQIVKIQINADINDVTDITSATFDQTLSQIESLRKTIVSTKSALYRADINQEQDRETLKRSIQQLEQTKTLINKIDMRISDVVSITSGLLSVFDKQQNNTADVVEE